ncbi:MAG TPA: phosphatase PAP2 family protein [Myxococcota bacterium]
MIFLDGHGHVAGVALALALGACATTSTTATHAPSTQAAIVDETPATTYLGPSALDATQILAGPPALDSPRAAADLAGVREQQALKDTPRWALAQSDAVDPLLVAFAPALGVSRAALDSRNLPKTEALIDVLVKDSRIVTVPAKKAFARKRPPLVDDKLVPCVQLETTGSYPSGHSTRGFLTALVLAEMVPDKANAILARGRDFGDSRVICAEHFPSDVDAGRIVAAAVVAAAHADAKFERDLAAARVELRAALRRATP